MRIRKKSPVQFGPAILLAGILAPLGVLHAAPPEKQAADVSTLQRQNAELAQKNTELEKRIRELEALRATTGEPAAKAAPALRDVGVDNRDYQFLKLGQDTDYMKAERYRIIDQVQQAIPPLYEPARPLHAYVLPPGASRLQISVGGARNNSDFGRDQFYSEFFDKVTVNTVTANLQYMRGFEAFGIKDMMVSLNIPFKYTQVQGTGHPFRIDPMQMTMEGAGGGLGDVEVTLKKKWLDQGNAPVTFSTMLGVILPTGEHDKKFNASQTILMGGMAVPVTALNPMNPSINLFGRQPTDLFLPRSLQPGQGSWGGRIGAAVSLQFERSAAHAGFLYDFFGKNDGITVGNELRYGVSYVFPPLPSDRLSLDLAVVGMWKGSEKYPGLITHLERNPMTGGPVMDSSGNNVMVTTGRPDFKHGNVVFFSPSLSFIPSPATRFTLSPSIRIHQPFQGPSPAWMIDLSAQHTF